MQLAVQCTIGVLRQSQQSQGGIARTVTYSCGADGRYCAVVAWSMYAHPMWPSAVLFEPCAARLRQMLLCLHLRLAGLLGSNCYCTVATLGTRILRGVV